MQQGTKRMPGTAVTKSVVANEPGGRKREEIFVDIIEKISVTFSSSVSICFFNWLIYVTTFSRLWYNHWSIIGIVLTVFNLAWLDVYLITHIIMNFWVWYEIPNCLVSFLNAYSSVVLPNEIKNHPSASWLVFSYDLAILSYSSEMFEWYFSLIHIHNISI